MLELISVSLDEPEPGAPLYRDNGRYWEPVSDERLQIIVYELLTEKDKAQIYDCKKFCTNVTSFIKYECARRYHAGERFTDEDFKAIENHAVFRNCVYDLQNDRILSFNTELPYFFGLNADYIEDDVETEAWDKLKKDASGDTDSMDMMDLWTAYVGIPNMSAKQFAVPAHEKDSGKTTYGQFIVGMYEGIRAEAIDPDKLSGQFAYAKAATTLLYYCFDINTDQLKPREVSEIKKLTGEKYIRSEAKYQMATTVPIRFKVMLATNTGLYLSKGSHQDDAFYNRVLVLPFIHSRENGEMDNNMLDKLCEERSAILSKCVRKLGKIIRPDGGITIPESELSRSIKLSWIYKIDMVELFMQSKLMVTGEMEDAIPKEELHAEYVDFCHEKGKELDLHSCPILDSRGCANKIVDLARGKAVAKKLRRGTRENPSDVKLRPCITGLKWKEEQSQSNYKRFGRNT